MKNKNKKEFSKILLIQESVLIWIVTLIVLLFAFLCLKFQYFGELPWLTVLVGLPWSAYGVSQACYYRKAEKENTKGGIKYDSIFYQDEYIEHAEGYTGETCETEICD